MIFISLAHKKCMFIQSFNHKLFATMSSSTNSMFSAIDKNEYIRYQFPKINDSVDIKQQKFNSSFTIIPDIVTIDEELQLISEIEKSLKRLRYQLNHWDNV